MFTKELQEHLNKELFLGIKYYESHFSIYENGNFYEKHLDSFQGNKNRVLTTLYYLNENWQESDGGKLLLYNAKDELIQSISPQENTLVVFLSELFPHQVCLVNKKRYSIAGWYRVI